MRKTLGYSVRFNFIALVVVLASFHATADDGSHEPKTGPKNRYTVGSGKTVHLPTLLSGNFYKLDDVCKDAKGKKKKFALVAIKTHACDCDVTTQYCLHTTRNISDPCTPFLLKNFAMYHLYISPDEMKDIEAGKDVPGLKEVYGEWAQATNEFGEQPGIAIVDVEDCKVLGKTNYSRVCRKDDRSSRNDQTQSDIIAELKKIKTPSEKVKALLNDPTPACSKDEYRTHPEPTLQEVAEALQKQKNDSKK